jgi:MoxR-like ATPase
MLTGEAGYGKTTVGRAIAKHLKKDHLRVDCSVMLDTHAWFGTMQAKDGNTFFDPTEFTRVLEKGDCVIVLDEANRMNIEVANSLLPILDDSGEIRIRNTHIKAGKGVLFLVTLNEGIEYTGIGGSLDKAFQSRVTAKVTVHPLPPPVELQVITKAYPTLELEVIEKLVKIMNAFRDTVNRQRKEGNFITADVSTRVTKQIAWWLSLGLDFNLALRYALYNFITDDEKVLFSDTARLNGIQ